MKLKNISLSLILLTPAINFAQVFYSNGATVFVNTNALMHCNGGVLLQNNSQLTNEGRINTTINSTMMNPGNFEVATNAQSRGNGLYAIEQNFIVEGTFLENSSEVLLYGNREQMISSFNHNQINLNDLTLEGNGTGNNRKKTLLNTDVQISGKLNLTNRELATDANVATVINPDVNAITYDQTFQQEGFVSSTTGYLKRTTASQNNFIFPLGSSAGTLRFRPIVIETQQNSVATFSARLNNYNASNDGYSLQNLGEGLEILNDQFYHSVVQELGNDDVQFGIQYLPQDDSQWSTIANWQPQQSKWENVANTVETPLNNYAIVSQPQWTFVDKHPAYILASNNSSITIPNVFTPNGDGINDLYYVSTKGLTDYNFMIINRWGTVVFETTEPNTMWDGTFNGKPVTDGVYFYRLKAKDKNGDIDKSGHITIQ